MTIMMMIRTRGKTMLRKKSSDDDNRSYDNR